MFGEEIDGRVLVHTPWEVGIVVDWLDWMACE